MPSAPRRWIAIAACLALVPFFGAVSARAQPSELGVAPAFGLRSIDPGGTVQEVVTVVNLSDGDFSVDASLTDLAIGENGSFSSVERGSGGLPSAAGWGRIEPATFLLPRGHTKEVKLTFTPPERTTPRGYYAAARFAASTAQGSTVRSIHAVLLQVDGAGVLRAGTIAGLSVPSPSFGTTLPVTIRLENAGNVFVMASGKVTVRDALSRDTAVIGVARVPVIPGTTRIVQVKVPAPIVPGGARITAEFEFGEGVPKDSASITLLAFAWWHVAAVVLILLILVRLFMALVRRRRRKRRLKARAEPAPVEVAPVAVGDLDLQSSWEPDEREEAPTPAAFSRPSPPEPVLTSPEPVPPAPEPAAMGVGEDDELTLWPEPRVIPRPKAEPETEQAVRSPYAALESEPEPEPEPSEPEPEQAVRSPYAALESEPEREPEPSEPVPEPEPAREPAPPPLAYEPSVPAPVAVGPASEPEPFAPESQPPAPDEPKPVAAPVHVAVPVTVPPSPAPAAAREQPEPEQPPARTERLSALLKAGIPATSPAGREAGSRRIKVAVEMLGAGSGRVAESVDVALKVLLSAGAREGTAAVEDAFDAAASAGRSGAMGSLALALARLDSARAGEALLRAYAVAPRAGTAMLREALRGLDPKGLRAQRKLLAALPEDRRAALKLS